MQNQPSLYARYMIIFFINHLLSPYYRLYYMIEKASGGFFYFTHLNIFTVKGLNLFN